ncbi:hypothetical protein E2605_07705 [Dysgonomonas capnocytophagoides]|uniref:Uncharacterized protein n=1 Tax=Dysgonomonas capnocytophagoides TaxID=45254 RepID=A0A4Y8L863_9BACT|nr:hypothetical protein [Dysgonomonas capnocytophagoides]TFD96696.1 hypothetical protein E2605_07705 [Dysgonomonas capnocytophagoides]
MNRPDLNTLSKEVFEANKAKGFHDVEVSNETLLMLVIIELSEAVEADRKGKRALMSDYNEDVSVKQIYFKQAFEVYIKDTVEDELADAVIRLLDLAGLRGIEMLDTNNDISKAEINYSISIMDSVCSYKSVPDTVFWIVGNIITYDNNVFLLCNKVITYIESFCQQWNIDLWQHVSLKLKYNQTRPIKHGKNY